MTMTKTYMDDGSDLQSEIAQVMERLTVRQQQLAEEKEELEKARQAFEKEKNSVGPGGKVYTASDVIILNVGGTKMATLRRTLTSVEGSLLASMFSGRWDDSLEKDSDGAFFIDQSPDLFQILLDYFRDRHNETAFVPASQSPSSDVEFVKRYSQYMKFLRMLDYYGLTLGVYPFALRKHDGSQELAIPASGIVSAGDSVNWSLYEIHATNHSRQLKAFEITIEETEGLKLQIGWLQDTSCNEESKCFENEKGVGNHVHASDSGRGGCAIDTSRSEIVQFGSSFEREIPPFKKGTIIRCGRLITDRRNNLEHFNWSVDGIEIDSNDLKAHSRGIPAVPAISGRGRWRLSKLELEIN